VVPSHPLRNSIPIAAASPIVAARCFMFRRFKVKMLNQSSHGAAWSAVSAQSSNLTGASAPGQWD
jgi:hypothetical protein